MAEFHIPVLLNEVLDLLAPKSGQIFVDCTLGGAGHAGPIARALGNSGALVGIDLDPESVRAAKDVFDLASRGGEIAAGVKIFLERGNYKDIKKILQGIGMQSADGILADLGMSSYDLDRSARGFSFRRDEPLDMRFNPESAEKRDREIFNAEFVLKTYSREKLADIFKRYGEEKFAFGIAGAIVKFRQSADLDSTLKLFAAIKSALPAKIKFRASDSASRIFQALRIEVNNELGNLEQFLPDAFELLNPGGRLAVISFHSLEDRIVKNFFKGRQKGCVCPPDFPQCACGKNPEGKILTPKPVIAGKEETESNPRSRPAKLRAIQKI